MYCTCTQTASCGLIGGREGKRRPPSPHPTKSWPTTKTCGREWHGSQTGLSTQPRLDTKTRSASGVTHWQALADKSKQKRKKKSQTNPQSTTLGLTSDRIMQNQTGLTVHYTAKQRPKEEKRQISPNTQTTRKQTILLSALRPLASTLSSGFAIWHARILTPQRFAVTAEWNCLPGNNCTIGLQFLCVVWTHLTPRKRQSRKEKQLSSDCTTLSDTYTPAA